MTSGHSEVEKLDGEGDYVLWKEKLLAHIELLGLLEGLEEDEAIEEEESTAETDSLLTKTEDKVLKEKRGKARSTVILSLGNHVLRKVIKEKTAAGMIRVLDKLFMAKSLPNRIYLKQRLYGYKMSDSMTIEENVNDFFKLISDLENVKVSVPDEDQAIVLLMSLPKQFDQLKDTLKYGKTTLALDEITGAIRSKVLELGASGKMLKNSSDALFVQDRGRSEKRDKSSERNKSQSRSKSREKKVCWVCGKEGHFKKQCYVWKEKNKKGNNSEKGESSNVIGQAADAAALAVREESNADNQEVDNEWIMDTGCSFHMTPRRDWFVEFDESQTGRVKMANQTYSEIKGIGSIRIQNDDNTTVLLKNVRYVPSMSKNLISMGTLEDQGCWFQSKAGTLKVVKGCMTLLKGKKVGTLYLLQGVVVTGNANAVTSSKDESKIWHSRLCHMSQRNIDVLIKKGCLQAEKINGLEFCEDCVYGKTHRVGFGSAKHVTREKLEYIHSDLWGAPSVPNSLGNCQYFITFIDDLTRKVWIYFLKKKEHFFSCMLMIC